VFRSTTVDDVVLEEMYLHRLLRGWPFRSFDGAFFCGGGVLVDMLRGLSRLLTTHEHRRRVEAWQLTTNADRSVCFCNKIRICLCMLLETIYQGRCGPGRFLPLRVTAHCVLLVLVRIGSSSFAENSRRVIQQHGQVVIKWFLWEFGERDARLAALDEALRTQTYGFVYQRSWGGRPDEAIIRYNCGALLQRLGEKAFNFCEARLQPTSDAFIEG
jgi:hypothetical protein